MSEEWINYDGGQPPVNEDKTVSLKLRCGLTTIPFKVSKEHWTHNYRGRGESRADPVAYRKH